MPATAGTGAKPLFVNDMQLLAEDTIKAEQALTHADSLALMTLSAVVGNSDSGCGTDL